MSLGWMDSTNATVLAIRALMGIGLLSVVMFWHFHIREPRSGSLGEIGCNLDLANERKHIRGKPVIEQHWPEPIT